MIKVTVPYICAGAIMGCFVYCTRGMFGNVFYDYISIPLCVMLYFACLYLIQPERRMLGEIVKNKSLY